MYVYYCKHRHQYLAIYMSTCQLTWTLFFLITYIQSSLSRSIICNNRKTYMIPWHPDDSALLRDIWTIRTEIQIIHTSKHPMTERVHVLDYDIDTYVNVVYHIVTWNLRIWNFRWNINLLIITCIFTLFYQRHIIIYVSGFIECQVLHHYLPWRTYKHVRFPCKDGNLFCPRSF